MIIYCTSMSRSMKDIVRYAGMLVQELGSSARRATPEPWLNPKEQLESAETIILDHLKGGTVVVATTYELPLLRLMRRVREGELRSNEIVSHCISQGPGVSILRVDSRGEFVDMWPEGLFEERMGELF